MNSIWLRNGLLMLIVILGSGCGRNHGSGTTPTSTSKTATTTISTSADTPVSSFDRGDVNLTHLDFLVEDIDIAGQPMAITHIYSESPHYEWGDASGEGIACIDDSARAALVYLEDYEHTRDPASLDKARRRF